MRKSKKDILHACWVLASAKAVTKKEQKACKDMEKLLETIDFTETSDLICPYCGGETLPEDIGGEDGDDIEDFWCSDETSCYNESGGKVTCASCGKDFSFHCLTRFSSFRK